jgi:ferritin-like metal-binding protein YciE
MTAAKEKKESRSEAETAAASKKDANEQNSVSTDNKRISESNSSKANAMTEDAQNFEKRGNSKTEAKGQEKYRDAASDIPKMNPMMTEGGRTIAAPNEQVARQQSAHSRKENFVLHLNVMLSIENAAMERLHARIQQCPLPQVREQLVHHLQETRKQKDRLASLIHALGGQPTEERAQLAAYSPPSSLANALHASTVEEEKALITLAIDALIEQQEVLGYNTPIQYAAKMSIGEALAPMRQSLQEEEGMVVWTRANFPASFAQLWTTMEQKS